MTDRILAYSHARSKPKGRGLLAVVDALAELGRLRAERKNEAATSDDLGRTTLAATRDVSSHLHSRTRADSNTGNGGGR